MKTYYIQDTLENELDYTNFVQRVGKDHIQLFKKGEEPPFTILTQSGSMMSGIGCLNWV